MAGQYCTGLYLGWWGTSPEARIFHLRCGDRDAKVQASRLRCRFIPRPAGSAHEHQQQRQQHPPITCATERHPHFSSTDGVRRGGSSSLLAHLTISYFLYSTIVRLLLLRLPVPICAVLPPLYSSFAIAIAIATAASLFSSLRRAMQPCHSTCAAPPSPQPQRSRRHPSRLRHRCHLTAARDTPT